jgi:hypothetical protein
MRDAGFDPRTTALVTADSAGLSGVELPASPGKPAAGDRVTVAAYEPERVVLRAESEAPALLVIADAAYPGWQATVDGRPVPLLTTNLMFRGVALAALPRRERSVSQHPTHGGFQPTSRLRLPGSPRIRDCVGPLAVSVLGRVMPAAIAPPQIGTRPAARLTTTQQWLEVDTSEHAHYAGRCAVRSSVLVPAAASICQREHSH